MVSYIVVVVVNDVVNDVVDVLLYIMILHLKHNKEILMFIHTTEHYLWQLGIQIQYNSNYKHNMNKKYTFRFIHNIYLTA